MDVGDSQSHLLGATAQPTHGLPSFSALPEFNFDAIALNTAPEASATCSVRGCPRPLAQGTRTKMCEVCRSRHRVYASTKRARRKLEKNALALGGSATTSQPATPAPVWDDAAIDPRLFAEPAPIHIAYTAPFPPSSSSSELAGALTLPAEASTRADPDEPHKEVTNPKLNATLLPIEPAPGEDTRPCSVKGCKAVIPDSYNYRMCPPCRTRYRSYGNTKRAKWKAEREACDRELAGLRTEEDERRSRAGMGPLSDSPEDLRAWELSIIDAEVARLAAADDSPAPDSKLDPDNPGYTGTSALGAQHMNLFKAASYPVSTGSGSGGDATPAPLPTRMCTVSHCHRILPGFYRYKRCEQHRAQNRYHSRLKRVREMGAGGKDKDQDGQQQKDDVHGGTPGPVDGSGPPPPDSDTNPSAIHDQQGGSNSDQPSISAEDNSAPTMPAPRRRPTTRCTTRECANLLVPQVRWRHCDICRARERVLRRERKEAGGSDNSRAGEGPATEGAGTGSLLAQKQNDGGSETAGDGPAAVESVEPGTAAWGEGIPSLSVAMDLVTGDLPAPEAQHGPAPTVSASAPSPPPSSHQSWRVTSYPHTFQSVFSVAPSPAPAPSPCAAPAGLGTGGELVIHEYQPRPQPGDERGGGGGGGEELHIIHEHQPRSGDAHARGAKEKEFREMVQRDQQTSTGMVGPSSYHVYRATTSPPPTTSSTPVSTTSKSASSASAPAAQPRPMHQTQSTSAPRPQYYSGPAPPHYPISTQHYPDPSPYGTAGASLPATSAPVSASAPEPAPTSASAPAYVRHEPPPQPPAKKPKITTTTTTTHIRTDVAGASAENPKTSVSVPTPAAPAPSAQPASNPEQAQAQAPSPGQTQACSPAPTLIPRQRKPAKPRASRAKPKPAPPPPPTPTAHHYPYGHPYSYYMPGYEYGAPHPHPHPSSSSSAHHAPYGYAPPPPPPSSTSTSAAGTSGNTSGSASTTASSTNRPSPYIPYPHPHAYHAYPYPGGAYAYLPPPIQPGQYPYTHPSHAHPYAYAPYGAVQSSGHAHAQGYPPYGGVGYAQAYPHAQARPGGMASSYYQARPSGTPDARVQGGAQPTKKRKRDGDENENEDESGRDKEDERRDDRANDGAKEEREKELPAVATTREQANNATPQANRNASTVTPAPPPQASVDPHPPGAAASAEPRPVNDNAFTAAPVAAPPPQPNVTVDPRPPAAAPITAAPADPRPPPINASTVSLAQPETSSAPTSLIVSAANTLAEEGQPRARPCAKKTCPRTLPSGTSGTLCGRCTARIKRHQAKARQRFKLEPRKSVLLVKDKDKDKDRGDWAGSASGSRLEPGLGENGIGAAERQVEDDDEEELEMEMEMVASLAAGIAGDA